MGLQSQLNDVGSDSIPLLLLALIASCVSHLRSILTAAFSSVGLHSDQNDVEILHITSNLAGIISISDHRLSLPSFLYSSDDDKEVSDDGCIICLNQIKDGDWVRRLPCKHIFHKSCFDGWLDQMKFNCPLCRSQLISDWRVDQASERRMANDLAAWFAVR